MSSTPIGDYALISDCHSGALVSRAGSIDWLCFSRFDGPSVFARLLDDAAGHWSVAPEGGWSSTRRYVDRSTVLETTFRGDAGVVVLTDAMALDPSEEGHTSDGKRRAPWFAGSAVWRARRRCAPSTSRDRNTG